MKWWELNVSDEWQEAEVTITSLIGDPNIKDKVTFQNATMLCEDGMRNAPCSLMYFNDSKERLQDTDLGVPKTMKFKVKNDTSQYAFQGKGYMMMLPGSGGSGKKSGGWGGRKPETPQDKYQREIMMLTSYAKDLMVADKLKAADLATCVAEAVIAHEAIEGAVQAKFDDVPI